MKVAVVTHKLIKNDGQGRVNYETVLEALRRGHQITILSTEIEPQLKNQVEWISIPVKGWATEFIRNLVFSGRSGNWLRKNRFNLDLIQANGTITNATTEVNVAHFVHGSWLRSPFHISRSRRDLYGLYQWIYSSFNAYWEKKAFTETQLVIAVSDKIAEDLLSIGITAKNLEVIPNGVDLEQFSPEKLERDSWGLPDLVPLALFAGDIRFSRKNLDTVLKALVQVPELHLAVAGIIEGSPYPSLAASLGIAERVHFLGLRKDIAKLMKAVDFFVFPSRYEPFGLVVLEAMASGLPVITAKTTGASSLVTEAAGMVLANPDDREGLSIALEKLAKDSLLREKMGKAARLIALEHSWGKMAQKYVDLWEKIGQ